MAKKPRTWVYSTRKPPAPKMPASVKADVQQAANTLIETVLKPKYIEIPPASDQVQCNYLADIYTKWYRHYFYFCSKYCVPGPNALVPFFEEKFARLEYSGETGYKLSFMRHTGEWVELHRDLDLEGCLAAIADESYFHP